MAEPLGGLFMRKMPAAVLALSILVPTALGLAPTPASASLAFTSGPSVAGLAPLQVAGASLGPALAPSMPVSLTLTLPLRDQAGLQASIAAGAPALTPAQFLAAYGPTQASVDGVTSWAAAAGLSVTSVSANRTLVNVTGPASTVDSAFAVTLHTLAISGGPTVSTVDRTATLPAALSGELAAVVGLTGASVRLAALPQTSISYPTSYGPKDFWSLYDAGTTDPGTGEPLAVIAEGNLSGPLRDLRTFEGHFGLPQVPVQVVGAGSADTTGADEFDLDSQYSTGFAPGASELYMYDGPSLSNTDIGTEIAQWVTDDFTKQASFSAGECESLAFATGFTTSLDQTLAQAAAQGQSLFVSSGDGGGYCTAVVGANGVPAGVPDVEYPASSPYAIAVGGTSVLGPGPTETSWIAGGGGVSAVETAPAWQTGIGGSFVGVQRGVPDVALDADPESGYQVVVGGSITVIGGTSASAPSWQGIWARAQAAHGGALGFAGPVIYQIEPA
ncbi:MAG: S53 family peptidase, partial [Mycobacteriales bacterium]